MLFRTLGHLGADLNNVEGISTIRASLIRAAIDTAVPERTELSICRFLQSEKAAAFFADLRKQPDFAQGES